MFFRGSVSTRLSRLNFTAPFSRHLTLALSIAKLKASGLAARYLKLALSVATPSELASALSVLALAVRIAASPVWTYPGLKGGTANAARALGHPALTGTTTHPT